MNGRASGGDLELPPHSTHVVWAAELRRRKVGKEETVGRRQRFCDLFDPSGSLVKLAALPVVMRVDYRNYRQPAVIWTALALVGVALVVVLFSPRVNGATRWIVLGPLGIQPSELAKITVILFMAALLERRMERIDEVGCRNPEFYEMPVASPSFRVFAQLSD